MDFFFTTEVTSLLDGDEQPLAAAGVGAVERPLRMSHDIGADAAYISLTEIRAGEAVRQVWMDNDVAQGSVVLDFDADGKLLGIELLGVTSLLRPEVRSSEE